MKLNDVTLVVLAGFLSACQGYATTPPESPEQVVARLEAQRVDPTAYLASTVVEVKSESRDFTWASSQEAAIAHSFAQSTLHGNASLTEVDCRSTRCLVQVVFDAKMDYAALAANRDAASNWIAWSQPCSYTAATESAESYVLWIVTQCDGS